MCILSSLLKPWMLERMETTIETDVRLTFISIMWRLWASLFNYCFFLLITFDFWCNNGNDKMRKQILSIRWLTPWTLNTANISVKCYRTFFTIMKWNCIIVTNLNWFCVLSWGSINAIMLYNICYQLDSLLRSHWNWKQVQKSRFHWTHSDESMSYPSKLHRQFSWQ